MIKVAVILSCLLLAGCFSTQPSIQPTSQWEGHYYSFEALKLRITDQKLDDDQSIWLLSNTTLKRLLKDAGAK